MTTTMTPYLPYWCVSDNEITTYVKVLGRQVYVTIIPTEVGPSHKCSARLASGRKLVARSAARLGLATAKREAVSLAVALATAEELDSMEGAAK